MLEFRMWNTFGSDERDELRYTFLGCDFGFPGYFGIFRKSLLHYAIDICDG